MKNIITKQSACKVNCFKYLRMLLVVSGLLLGSVVAQAEVCQLKTQLNDPYIRAEYEEVIASSRNNNRSLDLESMYDNIEPASFSEERSFAGRAFNINLDPISKECIACHDGIIAREAKHRISNGRQQRTMSIETILGAHPVGMDYDNYKWNKQYVPAQSFPAAMVLMDGKVTCVTCHNLLGENKSYLVVDNDKSGLCFSCHIK